MKNIIIAAFAAVVLGAAIASCGSGDGNVATSASTPTPVPTPSTPCTPLPGLQVQVVYPQPLATGVTTQQIVIAVAPAALPSNYKLYVTVYDTATDTLLGTTFGSQNLQVIPFAQVPQPSLNPPFALPIYESQNMGGILGAGDTFNVFLANTNCYPGTSLDASFNT